MMEIVGSVLVELRTFRTKLRLKLAGGVPLSVTVTVMTALPV